MTLIPLTSNDLLLIVVAVYYILKGRVEVKEVEE
jgi:hypothetical protein